MTSILKNTLVAALMFTTVVSLANGPESTFGKKALEVEKNLISVELDPVFKKKGQKLFVNLLNLDQEKVTIKVIDSEGRIVFKEVIEGDVVVEKAFNFEQAYEDNYTVVIIDNDKTFKEKVAVK
ncbi:MULTISPECIES: hypothetical protein [Croceitalea]|uniref:DUF3244 domain-containing protein n=1 Tax=Croceitalea vernalis TaxID=3075599 RepID=A0ABU3BKX4_9FLAO|nr:MULTISPECIES: hypothetical protein [unclassified Croceitalea]MDT0540829.1 hypothetical protein [Croceitalea sp. P059]MDT0622808.1 hypothetical protein [Croceitalea sp. P007]